MNLHSIVSGAIAAINPMLKGTIQISNGYSTDAGGKRIPLYLQARDVTVQIQALSSKDLQQISGLNLNGELRAAYLNGELESVLRPENKGGDLITLPDGSKWLAVYALENWNLTSGWMKAVITRQNNK